jgi:hypothetical protein
MAVRRLVRGLWPRRRGGIEPQRPTTETPENRPLLARRSPLAASRSVLRKPVPAQRSLAAVKPMQTRSSLSAVTTKPVEAQRLLGAAPTLRPAATAEQRWRAAVAQTPLESPRPFPTELRPLVARLAGSADRASYTTGPATRRALTEVGALGATTGTVVHLTQQPSMNPSSIGVLAHELTHARQPIARPRFLLHAPGGAQDADERAARSVGDEFTSVARRAPGAVVRRLSSGAPSMRGMRGLPAMAGMPNLPAVPSMPTVPTIPGMGNLPSMPSMPAVPTVPGMPAIPGLPGMASVVSGLTDSAGGQVSEAASDLGAVSAGIVDRLPVGGAGTSGVVEAAAQAARSVAENAVRQTSGSIMDSIGGAAEGALGSAGNTVTQWFNGPAGAAGDAVDAVGGQVSAAASQAQGALGKAAGAGPGAVAAIAGADLDRIAEALEERLLRQLERRGGRYAGVF